MNSNRKGESNQAYEAALAELHRLIVEWTASNPTHPTVPRKTCAELMQYLAADGKDHLKTVTSEFDDLTVYPERPMILLSGEKENEPSVWLLGWRQGESTPVHDHGNSEAGVHVFEGSVTESIYVPAKPLEKIGDEATYRLVARELLEGSTVRITSPYTHIFTKTCQGHECIHATTLHCYWPRLLLMDFFEVNEEAGTMKFADVWADNG